MTVLVAAISLLLLSCGTREDSLDRELAVVRTEIVQAFARHGIETHGEANTVVGLARRLPDGELGQTVWCATAAAVEIEDVKPYIIAHELGHAMGLSHDDDPSSVMHGAVARVSATVAAEQLAVLCAANKCKALVFP